jgi:hypothetical protein
MLLFLILSTVVFAGKCPVLDGTFEKDQSYGTSALSIHVKHGKVSRDGVNFFKPDNSKHLEKDDRFGDSEISFECLKGTVVVHQNLVKLGSLLPYNKPLPEGGIPGAMTFRPAGKNAVMIEVSGENPVVKLVQGGKFKRTK